MFKKVAFALGLVGATFAQNTATGASDVHKAQATAKTSSPTSNVAGHAFDRFVVIWLENTDYAKAAGDPNLAALAKKGITLSNYFGVTHPSEPNYVAAIGGDNFGMENDNFNQIPKNVSTVIDLLEAKGISWAQYQEDMPYSGFEGMAWINQNTKANDYVRKHNPAIIYDANTTPQRLSQNKNLTMFYKDLQDDKLPQWMFITPNMTSDGHDTSVTTAGTWTSSFLTPLLNDQKFMKRTLVLVTFDEDHTYTNANRVLGILIGDAIPANLVGTTDDTFYNHYSEISTVEANWCLDTLGRWDVGANVFKFVSDVTGDTPRPWTSVTGSTPTVFLNESYAGPMNSVNSSAPWPVPNISLVHNNRKVAAPIASTYAASKGSFYKDTVEIPDGRHPPPGYVAQKY